MISGCDVRITKNVTLSVNYHLKQDTGGDWQGYVTVCGYTIAETPWQGFKTEAAAIKWLTSRLKAESEAESED